MLITLLSIITAFGISLVSTPLARKTAIRFRIFASPNQRTIHENPTPKLGGLSIFAAFAVGLLLYAYFTKDHSKLGGLLIGGGLVLVVGLLDDIRHLSCYTKLIGQTVAAVIAVFFGFNMETIYLPSGVSLDLGIWAGALSVFWIVSIINAVNLLDGLDGLASGFTIVVALFVVLGAAIFQNVEIAVIAMILVAASLGFLKYNFKPAKIFMGDSGSLFLGYTLACLSLKAFTLPATGSHIAVLMVLFLVPLTDTSLSILRRLANSKHPFSPDRKHIHHRLLDLGLSQTASVLIIYAVTFFCGVFSLILFVANIQLAIIIISGVFLLTLIALIQVRSFDFLSRKEYSEELSEYLLGNAEKLKGNRKV